jgi:hypothetical protein
MSSTSPANGSTRFECAMKQAIAGAGSKVACPAEAPAQARVEVPGDAAQSDPEQSENSKDSSENSKDSKVRRRLARNIHWSPEVAPTMRVVEVARCCRAEWCNH